MNEQPRKDTVAEGISRIVYTVLHMAKITAIQTVPVWIIWNAVVAGALKMPALDPLQTWGVVILCGLLFKSSQSITIVNAQEH